MADWRNQNSLNQESHQEWNEKLHPTGHKLDGVFFAFCFSGLGLVVIQENRKRRNYLNSALAHVVSTEKSMIHHLLSKSSRSQVIVAITG